jgi:arylsulfatase A-like enzyme
MTDLPPVPSPAAVPGPSGIRDRGRPTESLKLAVAVALLSALWFVGAGTVSRFLLHHLVVMSRDYLWMSPLSYLLFFLAAWLPVAGVGLLVNRVRAVQVAVFVFVSIACFALILPYPVISRPSAAILASALGSAAARVVTRSPDAWVSAAGWTSGLLGLLFAVVAVAGAGWGMIARHRALAALPAAAAGAPNVLLIILDTVRGDELGSYGYDRPTTPNLDAFATQGVLFESAIATSSWSLPSHASLFTGHYAGRLNADWTHPLNRREPTLAEVMAGQGYVTGGFVANLYYTGWDSGLSRGFIQYSDYQRSFEQLIKSSPLGQMLLVDALMHASSRSEMMQALREHDLVTVRIRGREPKRAAGVTDEFLSWSAGRPVGRPYFAFLNYFDAHYPFTPFPGFRSRFRKPGEPPRARQLYDAELEYLDQQLGRLFTELGRRGELDNTIVIVTADHGEQFGERGMSGHGNTLYFALLHVPLIIRFDGHVPVSRRVREAVSLRDIGATILDLAETRGRDSFPGQSLAPYWRGDTASTSPAIAELNRQSITDPTARMEDREFTSLVEGDWHLIRQGKRAVEEMFQFRKDPAESTSLVGSTEGSAALLRMRQTILRTLISDAPDTVYAAKQARAPRRSP